MPLTRVGTLRALRERRCKTVCLSRVYRATVSGVDFSGMLTARKDDDQKLYLAALQSTKSRRISVERPPASLGRSSNIGKGIPQANNECSLPRYMYVLKTHPDRHGA